MKIHINILCLETALLIYIIRGATLRDEFVSNDDDMLENDDERLGQIDSLPSSAADVSVEVDELSYNKKQSYGTLRSDRPSKKRNRPFYTSKTYFSRNPLESFSNGYSESKREKILKFHANNRNSYTAEFQTSKAHDSINVENKKFDMESSEELNVFPATKENGQKSEVPQFWNDQIEISPFTENNEAEKIENRIQIETNGSPSFLPPDSEELESSEMGNFERLEDEISDETVPIEMTASSERLQIEDLNTPKDEVNKTSRFIDIFSKANTSDCTTPTGENGHCESFADCPLRDAVNNYSLFLQHLCLLNRIFVGICCPNNPVVEISEADEDNSTKVGLDIQQPPQGCGLAHNTRIVGGTMSVPHQWTWMVALLRRNRFYCGGVIINNWYILTAAHCVLGIKVRDLKIRLGEYNFQEQNEHQQDIPVAEIKRHAMFVTLTFQHDIALLKLKRKVEYTKFIGSICLPDARTVQNYTDVKATVVGWGTVSFGGAASPVLRQVTIPVWDNEDCDRSYLLENINESFLCAGAPENGEDACQGDSGGPLMTLNAAGRWEVIGIVSWGRRCGDPRYPGVYTRVTSYLDWIAENSQ